MEVLGTIVGVLVHPSARLPRLADHDGTPRLRVPIAVVAGAGLVSLALGAGAALLEPTGPGQVISADDQRVEVGVALLLPVVFVGFWLVSGYLIDGVARLMGREHRRRVFLLASAYATWALIGFNLIRLVQSLLDRAGPDVASGVSTIAGLAAFVVLAWYVALLTGAARAVYDLPALSALSAALLPFAAMATLLVLFLVVASGLHGAGVI